MKRFSPRFWARSVCGAGLLGWTLLGTTGTASAQPGFPGPTVIKVPIGHAPLLAFRLDLPAGSHALWPSKPTGNDRGTLVRLEPGTKVLLRPGYAHAFVVVAGEEGQRHCATIEVFESLRLPPVARIEDHPAPVIVHPEELLRDNRPKLVTKAITVLKNPAEDDVSRREGDQPEIHLAAGTDWLKEACSRGKMVAVLRLGSRTLSDGELLASAVGGTAMLPGQAVIGPPAMPPYIRPPHLCAGADGALGEKDVEEEIIKDGGDRGVRAGIDNQGRIFGVDSEDAVAAYTNAKGERRLVHSNRVCIVAPRFQSLVLDQPVDKIEGTRQAVVDISTRNQGMVGGLQKPGKSAVREAATDLRGRLSATQAVQKLSPIRIDKITFIEGQEALVRALEAEGTRVPGRIAREKWVLQNINKEGPKLTSGAQGLSITRGGTTLSGLIADQPGPELVSSTLSPRDLTIDSLCDEQASAGPLELRKCCDKQSANTGDVLTFTLRFSNASGRPLKDIALVDALNPRLEYMEGTSQCSRDALFLQQVAEDGTAQLRWEIQGVLQPGDHAVVQFKVRVK